ncbi:hypothetical protein [Ekhidna sp.]|uniref:hypothetical protein n=1 Tax=Ekhidna sp. TaxID=2608089 RepID=UPI003CCC2D93
MKKVILSICTVVFFAYTATAQFHFELGPNFNVPQGDFGDAYDLGIGFYIEPKYAFNENIDLGLVLGTNGFAGADLGGQSYGATSALVVLPTGTYRFSTSKVTPYAGLGLGLYRFDGAEVSVAGGGSVETEGETKFGFAPRAGVYLGRMNLGAAYNIVSDANYLQINLGVRILSRD